MSRKIIYRIILNVVLFLVAVFSLFPLFYQERIGCCNWGFVAGKYQTSEIKESTWQKYENGTLPDYVDFTKWVHDLYRPSHRPYDPREIKLIREICDLADAEQECLL